MTDPTSVANLLAAGYTEAADETCQEDALAAQGVWTHTHSSIALNPYQTIAPDGSTGDRRELHPEPDGVLPQHLGNRCTLGNNSIRTASLGTQYDQMYSSMRHGPDLYFQTRAGGRWWAICRAPSAGRSPRVPTTSSCLDGFKHDC